MDSTLPARALGAGRVAAGLALLAAPEQTTPLWIGKRRSRTPAARVLTRAMGARDLAIGAGSIAGGPLRPWLVAGLIADTADLSATLFERDKLPDTAVPLIAGLAGAGIVTGLLALALSGGSGDAAPSPA
jgi:hypothetical protein